MGQINIVIYPGEEDPGKNMANAIADLIHIKIMSLSEENQISTYQNLMKYLKTKQKLDNS
ncbi:hypothetical protein [Alkaliphilus crotonatoxidans]